MPCFVTLAFEFAMMGDIAMIVDAFCDFKILSCRIAIKSSGHIVGSIEKLFLIQLIANFSILAYIA